MKKYLLCSILLLTVASTPASAQDLNALRERASQLWTERLQANKTKAVEFIETEGRSDFPMFENVREAKVTGLEFTEDKLKILVFTKAKSFFPTIGMVEQIVTEPWVWKSGNWFVHVEAVTPFLMPGAMSANAAATIVRSGLTFQLVDKKIDLGTHKQGDKISGTVKFTSSRAKLQVIRARGLDGFRVGATKWIDDTNGEMEFTIDSSLMSEDIDATVVLEGAGQEKVFEITTVSDKLAVVGRIQGRIRISQLPVTPEAEKGRFAELEIKNVGTSSFRVEAVRSLDSNFFLNAEVPMTLPAGQAVKAKVTYLKQDRPTDGELIIQLSEGVLPSNSVLFRVKGAAALSAQQPKQP